MRNIYSENTFNFIIIENDVDAGGGNRSNNLTSRLCNIKFGGRIIIDIIILVVTVFEGY